MIFPWGASNCLEPLPVAHAVGIAHIFRALRMPGHLFGQSKFQLQALEGADVGKRTVSGRLAKGAPDEEGEKMRGELGLFRAEMHTILPWVSLGWVVPE